MKRHQDGLGAITIIVVLVVLAGMAAAIVRLNSAAQSTATQELLAARAGEAARAGLQWGLHQAFKGSWKACNGDSSTLDLGSENGMHVTVSCHSTLYNEGESTPGTPLAVRVYTLNAVACNGSGNCPDEVHAARPGYVERRWEIHATE